MKKNISQKEYLESFGIGSVHPDKLETLKLLFQYAIETRNFEIKLYWERAKYFWTFIAVTFGAFGWIIKSILENNPYTANAPKIISNKILSLEVLVLLISSIGLVFSIAWYLANRGSKMWQENWENQVALLEDYIIGPLFKTILLRHKLYEFNPRDLIIGPQPFSVSKINQILSLFVTIIWFVFWIISFFIVKNFIICILDFIIVISTICALIFWGRTDLPSRRIDYILQAKRFTVKIYD